MSRKLLVFYLSELKTVRIVCEVCGAAKELTVDQLVKPPDSISVCPGCGGAYGILGGHGNPLTKLGEAVKAIQQAKADGGRLEVEFVLPDKSA